MRIGELSDRSQVSTRSIRHYEAAGLITAARMPNGYRDYDEQSLPAVIYINWLISVGLTLKTVREILPCVVEKEPQKVVCERTKSILMREFDRLERQATRIKRCQELLKQAMGPASE
jgi:DNA-binding transcriptional MerR regulator